MESAVDTETELIRLRHLRDQIDAKIAMLIETNYTPNNERLNDILDSLSPELIACINELDAETQLQFKQQLARYGMPDGNVENLIQKFAELKAWKEARIKAAEAAKIRRQREANLYGHDLTELARKTTEERRKSCLTPIQVIEDAIITQRQFVDMENNCAVSYRRPGEHPQILIY
ncbi:MAG: hypothetical protein WC346_02120 [Methanogenium sp.]